MVAPLVIGGIAVAVGIGVIIAIARSIRQRRDYYGSRHERAVERQVGLGAIARAQRQVEQTEKAAEKEEKVVESVEKAEAAEAAETADKVEEKADLAVVTAAKSVRYEEAAEEVTGAIEGRVVGVEAAVKEITRAIIDYSQKVNYNLMTEEEETTVLDQILRKIQNTINYGVIDNRINVYLREYLGSLIADLRQNIATEREIEKSMRGLINKIEEAIGVMKSAINSAIRDLRRLKGAEKKIVRSFKKEFNFFKDALNAKVRNLKALRSTKNPDPNAMAQLVNEISLIKKQLGTATTINQQLEQTYAFMQNEIKEMRRLLRYVKANEKEIKRYEKVLSKRKKDIDSRLKRLEDAVESIEKIAAEFKISNPHEVALLMTSRLKSYFDTYSSILQDDIVFDSYLRAIAIKDYVISKQMEAFQQFEISLTNSQKAVGEGESAVVELLSGIIGDKSKINAANIIKALKNARSILDYEGGIESRMKNLATVLKRKSTQLASDVQSMINKHKEVLAKVKLAEDNYSAHIGTVMGTMVNRKIAIDTKYMTQAQTFGEQLIERNKRAGEAYQQAMRLEAEAAAA